MSISLFDDLWSNALDPSYAAAADAGRGGTDCARSSRAGSSRSVGGKLWTAALLVLVGVGITTGIDAVRNEAPSADGSRAALIRQVHAGNTTLAKLEAQLGAARTDITRAQSAQLASTANGAALQDQLAGLEGSAGGVAVSGPGITVRLADPSANDDGADSGGSEPPLGGVGAGTLTDRDLQAVVNALWAAGAEAISVGGQRLGPTSAIRTAGSTVLVDFRPVTSPYTIAAIGDTDALQAGLADSAAGRTLQSLHNVYGVGVSVARSGDLHLDAATLTEPLHAQPGRTP
ncbi:MAG TPA: DUF881 domain-containing protein [Mycobacteriales bacterium]|nr:DUF881 domain-containing protein [Mycobacteriales bacterium]